MFHDRSHAGHLLAVRLEDLAGSDPLVLALPRGGVPVAAEVADALDAQLDVLVIRKLADPRNPEYAFGSVGEDGIAIIDQVVVESLGLDRASVERIKGVEQAELVRRVGVYRGIRPAVPIRGREVIIVDDGIATGSTARAAVELVRQRGAKRIVIAAPVASRAAVQMLAASCDEVVVLDRPPAFRAVGMYYSDFSQLTDDEVTQSLALHRHPPEALESAARDDRAQAYGDGQAATQQNGRGTAIDQDLYVSLGKLNLSAHLCVPRDATGIVLFAHGSGSSRFSPRNTRVAGYLNSRGIGTLLFDLLTPQEASERANVFNISLLTTRLAQAALWLRTQSPAQGLGLPIGFFGASTGAAAAIAAAAMFGRGIAAVVSRGGRPDLAGPKLAELDAPTLLIVGDQDPEVLRINRHAASLMHCPVEIALVPGAGHLFEEPGAMDRVCELAADMFASRFMPVPAMTSSAH